MLYRPISAYPNENNAIDALLENTFTSTVQGSASVVVAYKATIYKLSNYTQVYTTEKQTLTTPLTANQTLEIPIPSNSGMVNGVDYYWVLSLYQSADNIFVTNTTVQSGSTAQKIKIRAHSNVSSGMTLLINGERRKISSYTINESGTIGTATVTTAFTTIPEAGEAGVIYTDYVDSLQFPFGAKKTPELSFVDLPNILTQREYKFVLDYQQEQGIPVKWYRLEMLSIGGETLLDTGRIFSSLLEYTFAGFVDGEVYYIRGTVENTDGVFVETGDEELLVQYSAPDIDLPPELTLIPQDTAVKIAWVADAFSEGETTGSYHFVEDSPYNGTNSLYIDDGTITYSEISNTPLLINDTDFTVFTDITVTENTSDGKIIEMSGDGSSLYVSLYRGVLYAYNNGEEVSSKQVFASTKSGQQTNPNPENNVNYIWMDTDIWDDTKYWTENLDFSRRYKVTLMPNTVLFDEP